MKMKTRTLKRAFTLIELMIVIAIIAILATIAIPSYNDYTTKAALSELLQATSAAKSEVEICGYSAAGDFSQCSTGSKTLDTKYVSSVSVGENGTITATGKGTLAAYSYTLTPSYSSTTRVITWTTTCTTSEGGDKSLFPAGFCS